LDTFSKSDPMCVMFTTDARSGQFFEVRIIYPFSYLCCASSSSCTSAGPSLEHRRTGDYVQSDSEALNRAGIKVDKNIVVRLVERAQPSLETVQGGGSGYDFRQSVPQPDR